MKVNLGSGNFRLLAVSAFFVFISSSLVLASITAAETKKNLVNNTELSRDNWRICAQQNEDLVESFYIETANFFANLCEKPDGILIFIGGEKANPDDAIKIPAMTEEGTGYVAEDGEITYIVTGATFSIVKNGKTISEEQVIYLCSQFSETECQQR